MATDSDASMVFPFETGTFRSGLFRANRSVNYLWSLSIPTTESSLPSSDLPDDVIFDPDDFPEGSNPATWNGDEYFIHDDTTVMVRVVERLVKGQHINDIQLFF